MGHLPELVKFVDSVKTALPAFIHAVLAFMLAHPPVIVLAVAILLTVYAYAAAVAYYGPAMPEARIMERIMERVRRTAER